MTTPSVVGVGVVIPARNEEQLLPRCLDSVKIALDALKQSAPELACRCVLVLDSCVDSSADVVASRPWVTPLRITAGAVGVARAAGVDLIARMPHRPGATLWIANTDADTVVPPHWLTHQLTEARRGFELVIGSVHPDAADLDGDQLAGWRARHLLDEGHHHVHGANLGFTLEAYRRAGGFPAVAGHEDVRLVRAMKQNDTPWMSTVKTQVVTSGRRWGRAPGGFATYLRGLRSPDTPADLLGPWCVETVRRRREPC